MRWARNTLGRFIDFYRDKFKFRYRVGDENPLTLLVYPLGFRYVTIFRKDHSLLVESL